MSTVPFLHLPSGAYDLPAILRRAWTRARNAVARCLKARIPTTLRAAFADALHMTWDEARGARAIAQWAAADDAARAAAAARGAREAAIYDLRSLRAAADGIDNTARFLAERDEIEARLGALRAA